MLEMGKFGDTQVCFLIVEMIASLAGASLSTASNRTECIIACLCIVCVHGFLAYVGLEPFATPRHCFASGDNIGDTGSGIEYFTKFTHANETTRRHTNTDWTMAVHNCNWNDAERWSKRPITNINCMLHVVHPVPLWSVMGCFDLHVPVVDSNRRVHPLTHTSIYNRPGKLLLTFSRFDFRRASIDTF